MKNKKAKKTKKGNTMKSTLSDMMLSENENVKRHAKGIYKELQK